LEQVAPRIAVRAIFTFMQVRGITRSASNGSRRAIVRRGIAHEGSALGR
jgi:hypothetical protein